MTPIAHSDKFNAQVSTPVVYELLDNYRPVGCVRELVLDVQFGSVWQCELYGTSGDVWGGHATAQEAMNALVSVYEYWRVLDC
jgi:hypothetical protein